MATLTLSDDQVTDLIRQLPAERRRSVLLLLAEQGQQRRHDRLNYAESQLRELSTTRGLDWHVLSEEEREHLIDAFWLLWASGPMHMPAPYATHA